MSYRGSWKIDDYVTFCCNTHDPDTGVATDADSVPTYRVYEDETGTPILTGSMALLDAANTTGFYSERIQLTAANGFEKGKCYTVYITATVDSDTGTMHHNFQIEAEVDANTVSATPDVNVTQISGDTTAANNLELITEIANITSLTVDVDGHLEANVVEIEGADPTDTIRDAVVDDATRIDASALNTLSGHDPASQLAAQTDISGLNDPTAAAIADQVWDETKSGHTAAGSFGEEAQAHALSTEISALNDPTAAAIADAVWDEASAGHTDAGKAGQQLWTDLDAVLADTNELQTDDTPAAIAALNDPTAAAIADAVWDEASAGHTDAGKAGQQLWTDLDAVLTDTNELQTDWHDGGRLDLILDAASAPSAATVADAVWDEAIADHAGAGSTGAALAGATAPSAATVADAVWDEALADHDTEDSFGNVINDLTEEASGTYRFTSAALQSTLGAGAITFTYTLISSVDSSPIASATVWVTTDQAGSNVVASGTTNTSGEVVFYLDAGTYYIWREKAGWNFTNPDTEAVA